MDLQEIKQTINELCFHIFFQTNEGKTLLAALEKFYCTTDGILPSSQLQIEQYGSIECYLAYQLGKKSFIHDLKRFAEGEKQRINQEMGKQNEQSRTSE